jgi:hypothetical protein
MPGLKEIQNEIDALIERVSSTEAMLVKNESVLNDLKNTITNVSTTPAINTLQMAVSSTPVGLVFDNLAIFNRGMRVDEIGSNTSSTIALLSDTLFIGRPFFNQDSGGFALIRAGETSTTVNFAREYLEQPIVNTSISLENNTSTENINAEAIFSSGTQYLVANKSTSGFKILINKAAPVDILFSWIALAVPEAKTFQSEVATPVTEALPVLSGSSNIEPDPAETSTASEGNSASTTPPAIDASSSSVPAVEAALGSTTPFVSEVPATEILPADEQIVPIEPAPLVDNLSTTATP